MRLFVAGIDDSMVSSWDARHGETGHLYLDEDSDEPRAATLPPVVTGLRSPLPSWAACA